MLYVLIVMIIISIVYIYNRWSVNKFDKRPAVYALAKHDIECLLTNCRHYDKTQEERVIFFETWYSRHLPSIMRLQGMSKEDIVSIYKNAINTIKQAVDPSDIEVMDDLMYVLVKFSK